MLSYELYKAYPTCQLCINFLSSWEIQGKEGLPLMVFNGIHSSVSLSGVSVSSNHNFVNRFV